jgi:hypothetical protein
MTARQSMSSVFSSNEDMLSQQSLQRLIKTNQIQPQIVFKMEK